MTSYFNACDITVANSNHKICYNFFLTCTCAPHFEKGSATHGFIQWHMVIICVWYGLFVTSQFDVILMFPNQRFGEVFWHNIHILPHAFSLCVVALSIVRISVENTLNATTQQFKIAKISGLALKHGSKTHSSLGQSIYDYNFCIKSTN